MRGPVLILSLSALAAASPVAAENWRRSSQANGAVAYIDADNVQRDGDRVTFWRELRWGEVRTLQGGLRYDRILALYEGDCRAMRLRAVEFRAKLAEVVVAASDEGDAAFTDAVPGTTAETDMRSACFDDWPPAG